MVLQNQSDYGATTIINNKILFSEVYLSGLIRLKGNFALWWFLIYPNQCILLGEPPLIWIISNHVGILILI